MKYFLCSITGKNPENYQIGLRSNLWGVEEKYKSRIERANIGDLLVFVVGGEFQSIHHIENSMFFDSTPLWPEKDGSVFPFRIKISDPVMTGQVPIKEVANDISFMKGKRWSGTIQGANGVFNDRLTTGDIDFIKAMMQTAKPLVKKVPEEKIAESAKRQSALFKFYEKDVEDHISSTISRIGLTLWNNPETGASGRQYTIPGGRIDLLCKDAATDDFVIVELKKGEAPDKTILQLLRYMSWIRQNLANNQDVRGIILTEAADDTLVEMIKEVPSIEIRYYRVSIELVT